MATTSRVSNTGWLQGSDTSQSSRVTSGGWGQINAAGGGDVTVTPSALSLTLAGQAPVISTTENVTVQPTAQALTLAQQSPVVSGMAIVQPTAQVLILTSFDPSVTTDGSVVVSVTNNSLSLAQQNTVVSGSCVVNPTAQSLALSQQTPIVSLGVTITTNVLSLILNAYGPVMHGDGAVTPANLQIALGLNEPTTPGLGITIYPSYLGLTISSVTGITVQINDLTPWLQRQNIDDGGWNNRRATSAPTVIGSGSNGFTVFSMFMDGVIFFTPRHVRFGSIYAGPDQWTTREKGSASWAIR